MTYIIQTNNLTKIYQEKEVISNVNMHVKKGEIYGFLGPNGACICRQIYGERKPSQQIT